MESLASKVVIALPVPRSDLLWFILLPASIGVWLSYKSQFAGYIFACVGWIVFFAAAHYGRKIVLTEHEMRWHPSIWGNGWPLRYDEIRSIEKKIVNIIDPPATKPASVPAIIAIHVSGQDYVIPLPRQDADQIYQRFLTGLQEHGVPDSVFSTPNEKGR